MAVYAVEEEVVAVIVVLEVAALVVSVVVKVGREAEESADWPCVYVWAWQQADWTTGMRCCSAPWV